MLVKDLMKPDVATISPMATVRDALTTMHRHGVKSLVTEKKNAHDAYGIVTYSGILHAIVAEEGDIDLMNVYDIYIKPAIAISAEVDTKYVAQMMIRQNVKRLLVVDGNELAGLISMSDIVGSILAMADEGA